MSTLARVKIVLAEYKCHYYDIVLAFRDMHVEPNERVIEFNGPAISWMICIELHESMNTTETKFWRSQQMRQW